MLKAEFLFRPSMACNAELLEELCSKAELESAKKRRREYQKREPRRGAADGVGQGRWRIPISDKAWEELQRPERYDESSLFL